MNLKCVFALIYIIYNIIATENIQVKSTQYPIVIPQEIKTARNCIDIIYIFFLFTYVCTYFVKHFSSSSVRNGSLPGPFPSLYFPTILSIRVVLGMPYFFDAAVLEITLFLISLRAVCRVSSEYLRVFFTLGPIAHYFVV